VNAQLENSNTDEAEQTELRHPRSLELIMCRFADGILLKEKVVLATTKYIAISHTWGDVTWQNVDGIEGKVKVSDEKAKFLTDRLSELVGEEFFWIDILCVNQCDKDARVAVTQYIPAIFRRAQKTIAVRQGEGIRYCCYQAANFPRDPAQLFSNLMVSPFFDRLARHYAEHHVGEDPPTDGMISRLWPLQELLFSNEVHFVQCSLLPRTDSNEESSSAYIRRVQQAISHEFDANFPLGNVMGISEKQQASFG